MKNPVVPAPGAREFPSTSWALIAGARRGTDEARRNALDLLCRRYWPPVFHFVRRAWNKPDVDARDLTQSFFLWILEGDALTRFKPERGRFRAYLKMLLRSFAANEHEAQRAVKRGGSVNTFSLDGAAIQAEFAGLSAENPEQIFDWSWRREILDRAVERARGHFGGDRAIQFQVFEEYDLVQDDAKPTYAELSARLGLSEPKVRNYLFIVRERVRSEARAELAQTVTDPEQLEEEWRALFG